MSILFKDGASIEETLKKEGIIAAVTSGVSMRPLFKTHRDMVVLKSADRHLKKYDVVLYKVNGKYILHRIIKVIPEKALYIIRGDNTYHKEKVPASAVLAYLVSFNRRGKSRKAEDLSYRMYSALWNFIYPIRKIVYISKRALAKIYRIIKPQKQSVTDSDDI